ncbi:hypothetical protein AD951_02630 [Acetobacter malorum]|uniref:Uncharacterized protein n=1 Tax=Acetobacter malorum TaxID=178901 RepID=A0A149URN8_9PROT|nr:hypothetical protein [Acetobacter malorum]KXV70555.1 hypothetical protein AD951_02630 [Acetobacter malorum]
MQHGVNPSCDAVSPWEDTGIQGEHLKLEETATSVVTFRTPSSPEVRARYRQIAQDGEGDVPHPRFGDGWRLRVDILGEDGSIVDGSVFFRLFRGPEQIVRPYLLGLMTWDEDMRLGALITASLLGSLGYAQGKINPTEKPKEIKKSGMLPQLITLISNTPHGPRPSEAPHMMELIHEIAAVLMQEVKRRVGEIAPPPSMVKFCL